MIIRKLIKQKLKKECVNEYIQAHNNIWEDLVLEYSENGIVQCSCFLVDVDLYVFIELDDTKKGSNEVDKKWQEYMNSLKDLTIEPLEIKEVFRMKL
jgi:L-rhamnose mutarotase